MVETRNSQNHIRSGFVALLACQNLAVLLAVGLWSGCSLNRYEQVYVGLADGSVAELDACVPELLGERCDGVDNDCDGLIDDDDPDVWNQTQSDPFNCGGCGNVCTLDHVSIHGCREGACTVEACEPGYADLNHIDDDGCESDCIPTSSYDYCDGIDNNCDGQTDEDFDLDNDVHNCGQCDLSCAVHFADSSVTSFQCTQGQCQVAVCQEGYHDLDGEVDNGCEYYCVQDAAQELCDGRDNDCNGLTDDSPQGAPTCGQQGVCSGTQPTCTTGGYWECDYASNATARGDVYESPETATSGCDGKDNDCDGQTDEGFNVGQTCYAGQGVCRAQGQYQCNTAQDGTECSATPNSNNATAEVCDGQDNDCDGQVDELIPGSNDVPNFGSFVYVSSGNFTIFAYEASRPSASSTDEGFGDNAVACSVPGKMPWSNVAALDLDSSGDVEVRAICKRLGTGWDLCTQSQWYQACTGGSGQNFPYGSTYQANTCNGYDWGVNHNSVGPVTTGHLTGCARNFSGTHGGNVYDMSGNLKEWVWLGATNYEVQGGAYNNVSYAGSAPGLQCDGTSPMPADTEVHLPSIGFRCCYAGNLFQ